MNDNVLFNRLVRVGIGNFDLFCSVLVFSCSGSVPFFVHKTAVSYFYERNFPSTKLRRKISHSQLPEALGCFSTLCASKAWCRREAPQETKRQKAREDIGRAALHTCLGSAAEQLQDVTVEYLVLRRAPWARRSAT